MIARVVAIADVWDALTSDRSYRPGFAPQVALAHIAAGRGSHFEPALVDAFLALAADWGYRVGQLEGDDREGWFHLDVLWKLCSIYSPCTILR